MVTKAGSITIVNHNSDEEITINSDDLFFDVVDSEERSMGPHLTHVARFETAFDSGDDFELVVTVVEYPQGGLSGEPDVELNVHTDDIEILENNLELGASLPPPVDED